MGIRDDVKKIFTELLGPEFMNVIENFEDPEKYPKDFLDECKYFLEKIIGKEAAEKNLQPLYEKYLKAGKKEKTISSKGLSSFFCNRKIPKTARYSLNPRTSLSNYQLHRFLESSCNRYLL